MMHFIYRNIIIVFTSWRNHIKNRRIHQKKSTPQRFVPRLHSNHHPSRIRQRRRLLLVLVGLILLLLLLVRTIIVVYQFLMTIDMIPFWSIMTTSNATTIIQEQQQEEEQEQQQRIEHQELLSYLSSSTHETYKNKNNDNNHNIPHHHHHNCAINLYGLPRQYSSMIHQGILQNIVQPNLIYHCDYYIHYYNDTTIEAEPQQRGADIGHGNIPFDPNEIRILRNDIIQLHLEYYNQYYSHPQHPQGTNTTTTTTRQHITSEMYRPPNIQYRTTSEMEFQQQYHSLLQTIFHYHPSKPTQSQQQSDTPNLYIPYEKVKVEANTTTTSNQYSFVRTKQQNYYRMVPSFSNTTLINIIKMWHSQQSVFELMDQQNINNNDVEHSVVQQRYDDATTKIYQKIHYRRIGMFRNDVLYVTPIDIYEIPKIHASDINNYNMNDPNDPIVRPQRRTYRYFRSQQQQQQRPVAVSYDLYNQYAVIPNFANYPINDRMIYGPYDAIRIYATYKFRTLQAHIHSPQNQQQHYGIHSEQYLYHTIFPLIQQYGHVTILQHSNICFLRVRTDHSIRIADCGNTCVTSQHNIHTIIEQQLLFRSCLRLDASIPNVPFLICPPTNTTRSTTTTNMTHRSMILHHRNHRYLHSDSDPIIVPPPQWELCSPTP